MMTKMNTSYSTRITISKKSNLRTGVEIGAVDFLRPGFTIDDFWQFTHDKVVWMGPDIFVHALIDEQIHVDLMDSCDWFEYKCIFSVDLDGAWNKVLDVHSRSVTDATTAVCDYLLRLTAWSNPIGTHLIFNTLPSVSPHALSWFLENSRDSGGTSQICPSLNYGTILCV